VKRGCPHVWGLWLCKIAKATSSAIVMVCFLDDGPRTRQDHPLPCQLYYGWTLGEDRGACRFHHGNSFLRGLVHGDRWFRQCSSSFGVVALAETSIRGGAWKFSTIELHERPARRTSTAPTCIAIIPCYFPTSCCLPCVKTLFNCRRCPSSAKTRQSSDNSKAKMSSTLGKPHCFRLNKHRMSTATTATN